MVKKAAQATPNRLLRRARVERGWTQKVVAEHIGAPNDMMVTRWERGTAFPSAYYIERLCQLFEQRASDLGFLPEPHPMVSSHPLADSQRRPGSSEERAHSRTGMSPSFPRLAEVEESAHKGMRMQPWRSMFPVPLTSFFGREREIAALAALLRNPPVRLMTLTGPGGVGKTRLALSLAAEVTDTFADGVCFVPLAPISDPEQVLPAIAQALGLWEAGNHPLSDHVRDFLREKHLLLLLDNFEQVAAASPQVATLALSCPHLRLLITSRAALHLSGEYEFPVPPLPTPDLTQLLEPQALAKVAAMHLFVERAHAILPSFELTETNARTIAEICVRLDGLPLAIELAAARIKLLPPQALVARLSRRLSILTGGARDLPNRQQTLRNTLQWSYDLLTPQEQRLFRRLSVFVGGCTLQAAAAVCNHERDESEEPLDVLEGSASLVDKSFVLQTARGGR
jgi:predicted ATPase/transcriptional regulator with XRE-family HTH domain